MLNTSNYTAQDGVLRSGEELAPDLDKLKDPSCKLYFHRVKGAITHMPDGAQISFRGGMFATTNKEIQAFLDKIANQPASQVFTDTKAELAMKKEQRDAALAAMVQPGDQKNAQGQIDPTVQQDASKLVADPTKTSDALKNKA